MTKTLTRHLLAAALLTVGASFAPTFAAPAFACETIAAAETYGVGNKTGIDASGCAYTDGDFNRTSARVRGLSRVAVGQFDNGGEVDVDIEGRDNDVGVDASTGADVRVRNRGWDNDTAVYARGGRTSTRSEGIGNRTVIGINQ